VADERFRVTTLRYTKSYATKALSLYKKVPRRKELQTRVTNLTRAWRYVVGAFKARGVFQASPVKFQYSRNCVPSTGLISPSTQRCFMYSCPWCWSRRYAAVTYSRLKALRSMTEDYMLYYYDFKAVYTSASEAVPFDKLQLARRDIAISLNKIKRRTSFLGALMFGFVLPRDIGFEVVVRVLVASKKNPGHMDGCSFVKAGKDIVRMAAKMGAFPRHALFKVYNMSDAYYSFVGQRKGKLLTGFGCLYSGDSK
jgi:hypothetical protein